MSKAAWAEIHSAIFYTTDDGGLCSLVPWTGAHCIQGLAPHITPPFCVQHRAQETPVEASSPASTPTGSRVRIWRWWWCCTKHRSCRGRRNVRLFSPAVHELPGCCPMHLGAPCACNEILRHASCTTRILAHWLVHSTLATIAKEVEDLSFRT